MTGRNRMQADQGFQQDRFTGPTFPDDQIHFTGFESDIDVR